MTAAPRALGTSPPSVRAKVREVKVALVSSR